MNDGNKLLLGTGILLVGLFAITFVLTETSFAEPSVFDEPLGITDEIGKTVQVQLEDGISTSDEWVAP